MRGDMENLKCRGCSRFPQAAETWVDEGLCHGCREDLELGRLTLMATDMGFSVSRVGAEWRLHEPLMAAPLKRGTVSSLSAALAGRKEGA